MCSNDYLGLASDPRVCEEVIRVTRTYGFGSTGSPLSTGTTDIHEELKDLIAKTFRKEKALLFNSGYAANVGAIPSLVTEGDMIVADILSHQSIQDGLRMSVSTNKLFKHNSMSHLERVLKNSRGEHMGCLLITEGIFSMDGDCPDLKKFVSLAKEHQARTYLDEAHSFGVIGPKGLGAAFKHQVVEDIDIIMGTFSKICGGIGGFIAAPKEVIDWYFWLAKSHAFTVSIPPSSAAAMLKSMQIFLSEPQLAEKLQKNVRHFVAGLRQLGCPLSDKHEGAVVPVIVGNSEKFEIMTSVLYEEGIYTLPIEYPAVNKRGARFRFTIMATHTESDLDYALNVIKIAMQKANFSFSEVAQQYANVTTSEGLLE
jgi:8-amino-7-oxononanoate synthase